MKKIIMEKPEIGIKILEVVGDRLSRVETLAQNLASNDVEARIAYLLLDLKDKNTYFYIYEKIVINAFMTFLALKDMDIETEKRNSLSQAIFSQIKALSIISM